MSPIFLFAWQLFLCKYCHKTALPFKFCLYNNEELLLTKSKMLGHSNIEITKNVYTRHSVNQRMFDIVNTLGNIIKEKIYA